MSLAKLESPLAGKSSQELSQLMHDLKTPLAIISMGVEALKSVRHDDKQFAHLSDIIINDGVKVLNSLIDGLGSRR